MAEVADEDLNVLQKGMKLLQTMNANPQAKPLLEKALKALDPSIRTSEEQLADVAAPVLAEMTTLRDELKADRDARAAEATARKEADELAQYEGRFAALRRDEGLTDDGEAAIRKLMNDRNIADPDAAYAYFQKQNPTVDVATASYEPSHWNYDKTAVATDIDGLFKDPDRWADAETGRILAELRQPERVG